MEGQGWHWRQGLVQGAAVLVRGGHVGGQPRLGLHRVRQGEVGRELRLGTQVEVPAGGSMGMLRPLKRSTWKRRARPSPGPAVAEAPSCRSRGIFMQAAVGLLPLPKGRGKRAGQLMSIAQGKKKC